MSMSIKKIVHLHLEENKAQLLSYGKNNINTENLNTTINDNSLESTEFQPAVNTLKLLALKSIVKNHRKNYKFINQLCQEMSLPLDLKTSILYMILKEHSNEQNQFVRNILMISFGLASGLFLIKWIIFISYLLTPLGLNIILLFYIFFYQN